jgi:CPA1 family monovalent cation:H+ antiporter
MLLFAIVVSNVLDHVFPRLPLTLIQIGLGAALALLPMHISLTMNPEVFMALIIAPLLFREAEETDLASLWRLKRPVILMAFLLVFITVFAIGLSAHWLVPAIPLAACFALGAILGPTDVVTVSSLTSRIKLNDNVMHLLLGEGLINDASGLIAFRFSVAALLTGAFSVFSASLDLLYSSAVGALVGLALIAVKQRVVVGLRRLSVENTAAFMLLEFLMPFLSYLVAELLGVSGILAAVAAGSRQALYFKRTELFEAEFGATQHTLWDMATFTLNSIVFLLLGLQLPEVIRHIWENQAYDHVFLLFCVTVLTLILMAVRFLSVLFIANTAMGAALREKLKNTLVITLSGVKGAVSLATAFALPLVLVNGQPFAERPLLLFLTGGVIILSLLLAMFFIPLLAHTRIGEQERDPMGDILRETVAQLRAQDGVDNGAVITHYLRRIHQLEHAEYGREDKKGLRALRREYFQVELQALKERFRAGEINQYAYRDYKELLSVIHRRLARNILYGAAARLRQIKWLLTHLRRPATRAKQEVLMRKRRHELRDSFVTNTELVLAYLEGKRGEYPPLLVDTLLEERRELAEKMRQGFHGGVLVNRLHRARDDEMLRGYYVERRVIHQFLERGAITQAQANGMRLQVNKLETFTLAHNKDSEEVLKLISLISRRPL